MLLDMRQFPGNEFMSRISILSIACVCAVWSGSSRAMLSGNSAEKLNYEVWQATARQHDREVSPSEILRRKSKLIAAQFAGLDAARGSPAIALLPEPVKARVHTPGSMLSLVVPSAIALAAMLIFCLTKWMMHVRGIELAAVLKSIQPLVITILKPAQNFISRRRRGGTLEAYLRDVEKKHAAAARGNRAGKGMLHDAA